MNQFDTIIIGASAAGLMCAIEAGKRGRKTLVLDHANKVGKKILMSGGGRCNFTNFYTNPDNYISHNPHFCKSALSRYTPWDFISLVEKHDIPFHEKTLGQQFCDNKSKDIVNMLLAECQEAKATIQLETSINNVQQKEHGFSLKTSKGQYQCESLVIATGGLSIPTLGSTSFGYDVAKQFGIKVWPTSAGLVPFTLQNLEKERFIELPGISADSIVTSQSGHSFRENILFTHRGLSGPVILQISSYWLAGEFIEINLLPNLNFDVAIKNFQKQQPNALLKTFLAQYLSKRLLPALIDEKQLNKPIKNLNPNELLNLENMLQHYQIKPNGTEGYRTAEVTLGGVDCNAVSSKTMAANNTKDLYFIGEVLDVTGWLGGYNFQWAWASGWCAGQVV